MSTLTPLLVIGILLLVAIAAVTLVVALTRAEDGYEDQAGFHRIVDHSAEVITSVEVSSIEEHHVDPLVGPAEPVSF